MKASKFLKFNAVIEIVFFSLVLIVGIVFLTVTIFVTKKGIPENYVQTEGKIIRIEEVLSPTHSSNEPIEPSDYEHHVYICYTYEGKEYEQIEYPNYDSSMKDGDKVPVYVNPGDPTEIMGDNSNNIVLLIIGIVITVVGILGLTVFIRKLRRER